MATFAAPDSLAQLVEHNTFNVGVLFEPQTDHVKPVICRLFVPRVQSGGQAGPNIKVLFYFVKTSLFYIAVLFFLIMKSEEHHSRQSVRDSRRAFLRVFIITTRDWMPGMHKM